MADVGMTARTPDGGRFHRVTPEVYHCARCHKIVRTYDANTADEARLMLEGHSTLNCAADPGYGFRS